MGLITVDKFREVTMRAVVAISVVFALAVLSCGEAERRPGVHGSVIGADGMVPPLAHVHLVGLGDEVAIWGGIPSILFEPKYSDEDFDAYIKNMFQEMAPGYRFIVGMGDNLPFDGDLNRVRRVVELIDRYGTLPIEG